MSATRPEQLYETDFYAWTQAQAKELRRFAKTRPNLPLDLGHIALEIEDLGMSERSAVVSFVRLIHPALPARDRIRRPPDQRHHWLDEVDEFRSQIEDKLTPTIRRDVEAELDAIYGRARRNVTRKMRRYGEAAAAAALPEACPYTLEQILGDWEPRGKFRLPVTPRDRPIVGDRLDFDHECDPARAALRNSTFTPEMDAQAKELRRFRAVVAERAARSRAHRRGDPRLGQK